MESIIPSKESKGVHLFSTLNAPTPVFMGKRRYCIGKLPNTLTIDNIKIGTSIPRNPILFTNARYILPFVGVGSGIPRAIENSPDLELINDTERELFISIIKRPN